MKKLFFNIFLCLLFVVALVVFSVETLFSENTKGKKKIVRCEEDSTTTGTDEDEIFIGTSGDDDIEARGGDDTIIGKGGKDTVDAGAGDDTINTDGGKDKINAGSGRDRVNAGDKDDIITGGKGDDILNGGDGNDTFKFAKGDVEIYGEEKVNGGAGMEDRAEFAFSINLKKLRRKGNVVIVTDPQTGGIYVLRGIEIIQTWGEENGKEEINLKDIPESKAEREGDEGGKKSRTKKQE